MHQLTRTYFAAIAVAIIAGGAVAAPPSSVAIVSDTTGDAFVMSASNLVRLTLLSELQSGQVLKLEPGSRVVVAFLPEGSVYELAGAGRFRVGLRTIEPLDTKNPPRKRELPASLESLAAAATADVTETVVYALALEKGGLREEAQRYWSALAGEHGELRSRVNAR